MENLQIYINEIDTIFTCLNRLESLWPNQDNINFINNLKEYKEETINYKTSIEQEIANNSGIERQMIGEEINDR